MKKGTLLLALFLLAISGLALHYRIHYFMVPDPLYPDQTIFDRSFFMATLFPLIDVVAVTALFATKKTAPYGYLLNGLIVIFGTVFMAHFSIAAIIAKSIPFPAMILNSTLPDIGIAWADFLVGKALYDSYFKGAAVEPVREG
jgi:hypothetical protein